MAIRPIDIEIDTLVVISNGRHEVFKPGTTGEITHLKNGALPRPSGPPSISASLPVSSPKVRVTSGAYVGRTFSIHLDNLEIAP